MLRFHLRKNPSFFREARSWRGTLLSIWFRVDKNGEASFSHLFSVATIVHKTVHTRQSVKRHKIGRRLRAAILVYEKKLLQPGSLKSLTVASPPLPHLNVVIKPSREAAQALLQADWMQKVEEDLAAFFKLLSAS